MIRKTIVTLILTAIVGLSAMAANDVVLLPMPKHVEWQKGSFKMPKMLQWYTNVSDEMQKSALADAVNLLSKSSEPVLLTKEVKKGSASLRLLLVDDATQFADAEAYSLKVSKKRIEIKGRTAAALYRGLQTLHQLAAEGEALSAVEISDSPRYGERGVMLDVSRHFFSKEFIKKQIRQIATLKMNRLHIHLTDGAGWRLEIKKYPRLTQLAAWRKGSTWKEWWQQNGAQYVEQGTPGAYGGYYTQDDIKELVAYAKQHFITLVPEVEMPAHSEETLVAYPELSCTGVPYESSDFCPGNEEVYTFWRNVLSEVVELFPGTEVHMGGDEATKKAWHTCEKCQATMKKHNLADVNELQSYFAQRISDIAHELGTTIVGWDDLMIGGGAPKGSTVQIWGDVSKAQKAVADGHPVILSPGNYLYLDKYQDCPTTQPEAIGGYLPLEGVYEFGEVLDTIQFADPAKVRGVEACLWVEYIPTEQRVEEMLYPRLYALSEVGWGTRTNAEDFRQRAQVINDRVNAAGYSTFNLQTETGQRPEFKEKVEALSVGKPVKYNIRYSNSYTAGGDGALTDGVRGGWTYSDRRWQGFIDKDRMDVVIDLQKAKKISSVVADFMQVVGADVYTPAIIEVEVSDNGTDFSKVAAEEWKVDKGVPFGVQRFEWKGSANARYVRLKANCKSDIGGWIFTDEIVVK